MKLKFGKDKINFNIDPGKFRGLILPKTTNPKITERKIFLNSLKRPINSIPLEKFIDQLDEILIIIPDKTRVCGLKVVLPSVLKILKKNGIPNSQIKIIFANGSHSKQTEQEKINIIGKEISEEYTILEHDAFDDKQSVFFGKTRFGTDILLNKVVWDSDKIITIGTVVHHYFAGYGGGAKFLMPGLAHFSSIRKNHSRTITKTGLLHPGCASANLLNNPVFEDIKDSIRFCPPIFSINTILNEKGRIVECKCGNMLDSHLAAAELIDKFYKIKINNKTELVIVSPGGFPKDINFIQSHKSIQNAFSAVKENGVIICIAECLEGIGSKTFMDWFNYESENELKSAVLNNYSLNAQTALSLKEKLKKVKVILVSKLDSDVVKKLGMIPSDNINNALRQAEAFLGKNYKYRIIKNGSLILPY